MVEPPARPVEPPPKMATPREPNLLPNWGAASPLPKPRPVAPPELQPAPAELMYPAGALEVPPKHGTFGSPPIRLSRDYPPVGEFTGHGDAHTLGGADGGLANRFSVRGEYLQWWVPGFATPVLATTNANTDLNGYLGEPGTASLLGPGPIIDSSRSGFRAAPPGGSTTRSRAASTPASSSSAVAPRPRRSTPTGFRSSRGRSFHRT